MSRLAGLRDEVLPDAVETPEIRRAPHETAWASQYNSTIRTSNDLPHHAIERALGRPSSGLSEHAQASHKR